MSSSGINRRIFLAGAGAAGSLLPASIARAYATPANVRTGTIRDVEHVVVLTQENRSFNHYFGTLNGVRGFGDPYPVPVARDGDGYRSIWMQPNAEKDAAPALVAPFRLDTIQTFDFMRVEGTPHGFVDGQQAWDNGRMSNWPASKHNHAMGYYSREDIPFQFALADAFTICDAYFCAMHCSTNPNRLFIWTGTNDPLGKGNGPAINNAYDDLPADPAGHGGYAWTTYPERLQAAGVSWQVYQNMDDNFTDNPLEGFRTFREAANNREGHLAELARRGVTTRDLDKLRDDVIAGALPQVSWIVATAKGSEHPGTSSPAQGAEYTARVLDALTANPDVWARTVLLINFDENDGFFDHVPPPSVPARNTDDPDKLVGESNIPTEGEYHEQAGQFQHRAYGLGPRVPLYVISPWSRGGYVNSQVFDHTSIIRFLEQRFGVAEPNISAWRRSVCGDLASCFNFETPNDDFMPALPSMAEQAARASTMERRRPPTPEVSVAPVQDAGVRHARKLPYRLAVDAAAQLGGVRLRFDNRSAQDVGVCYAVHDLLSLDAIPRRYSVGAQSALEDVWPLQDGGYDLWVTGPDGFHRRFRGEASPVLGVAMSVDGALRLTSLVDRALDVLIDDSAYGRGTRRLRLAARSQADVSLDLAASFGWHDVNVSAGGSEWRYAGRVQTPGRAITDPAMHGPARLRLS